MPSDDEPSKNPFVRFKEHVDAHIGAGLHSVLNFPSLLSETVVNARQLSAPDTRVVPSRRNDDDGIPSSNEDVPPSFRRWLRGQRRAVATEEDMDTFYLRMVQEYPGDENEPVRRILWNERFDTFAQRSPYSPVTLAARLPRQPRPRDMHADMDPRMFTYIDAFEDLLAEASGTPTMDLRSRYNMNKMLRERWPFGESPYSWARRLESQGLIKAYLPDYRSLPARQAIAPEQTAPASEDRISVSTNAWKEQSNLQDSGAEEEQRPAENGLFGELERVVKALNQVLDDTTSSFYGKDNEEYPREPRTENDLYDAVQSAFNEAQRSLGTFFKAFSEEGFGIGPRPNHEAEAETAKTASETVDDENGTKTIKSTKEYIDAFGNKHVRTEITRTRRDGSVSSETRYSVRPASKEERSSLESSPKYDEPADREWVIGDEKRSGDRRSGWFWK